MLLIFIMPPKKKGQECSICLHGGHTKQVFNCQVCNEVVCGKCVGKLIEVCECGCPAAKYRCPTCRGEVAFVINQVQNNMPLMHAIVVRFREQLSYDFEDENSLE